MQKRLIDVTDAYLTRSLIGRMGYIVTFLALLCLCQMKLLYLN